MDDEEAYDYVNGAMNEGSIEADYKPFIGGGTIILITI